MADDLIHCPACGFQLRLPTDLYGTAVECPQCHGRFTAPIPVVKPVAAVRPPPGREYDAVGQRDGGEYDYAVVSVGRAAAALKIPAIMLIVLSGLTALTSAYGVVAAEKSVADIQQMAQDPDLPPQFRDSLKQISATITPDMVSKTNLVMVGVSLVTVLGGIQMLRRHTYWIAVIGAIFALNPINCPCCVAAFPVGIWALVVLLRADVRASFR